MQYQVRNNWRSNQDSNQSMHFICIAFSGFTACPNPDAASKLRCLAQDTGGMLNVVAIGGRGARLQRAPVGLSVRLRRRPVHRVRLPAEGGDDLFDASCSSCRAPRATSRNISAVARARSTSSPFMDLPRKSGEAFAQPDASFSRRVHRMNDSFLSRFEATEAKVSKKRYVVEPSADERCAPFPGRGSAPLRKAEPPDLGEGCQIACAKD
jgi:hypothetical protein